MRDRILAKGSWMILGGKTSFESSGARAVLRPLLDSGARLLEVEGPLPTVDQAVRLADEIGAESPDGIVAVGGGLVIDTMKAISLSWTTERPIGALVDDSEVPDRRHILTVAAPTTAGSGAEVTPFAVLYRNGIKHSLDDERLLPSFAVVDPDLSRSVPRPVAAASALDALAHCIESLWACRSTPESRGTASRALGQVVGNVEAAVVDQSDVAQDRLMYAASDAGSAIAVTRTTAAHALSYHLTSEYGVPHGHAVALTLGTLAAFNDQVNGECLVDQRGVEHVKSIIGEICDHLGVTTSSALTERMRDLMSNLGLATDVDAAAGRIVDRRRWVSDVNAERLANNPRRLRHDDLAEIVRTA